MTRLEIMVCLSLLIQLIQLLRKPVVITKFTRVNVKDPDRWLSEMNNLMEKRKQ